MSLSLFYTALKAYLFDVSGVDESSIVRGQQNSPLPAIVKSGDGCVVFREVSRSTVGEAEHSTTNERAQGSDIFARSWHGTREIMFQVEVFGSKASDTVDDIVARIEFDNYLNDFQESGFVPVDCDVIGSTTRLHDNLYVESSACMMRFRFVREDVEELQIIEHATTTGDVDGHIVTIEV